MLCGVRVLLLAAAAVAAATARQCVPRNELASQFPPSFAVTKGANGWRHRMYVSDVDEESPTKDGNYNLVFTAGAFTHRRLCRTPRSPPPQLCLNFPAHTLTTSSRNLCVCVCVRRVSRLARSINAFRGR